MQNFSACKELKNVNTNRKQEGHSGHPRENKRAIVALNRSPDLCAPVI